MIRPLAVYWIALSVLADVVLHLASRRRRWHHSDRLAVAGMARIAAWVPAMVARVVG